MYSQAPLVVAVRLLKEGGVGTSGSWLTYAQARARRMSGRDNRLHARIFSEGRAMDWNGLMVANLQFTHLNTQYSNEGMGAG